MAATLKSCAECRFSDKRPTYEDHDCRRHAPVMVVLKHWYDIREHVPAWPIVKSYDWCGDFERKPYSANTIECNRQEDVEYWLRICPELTRRECETLSELYGRTLPEMYAHPATWSAL